MPIKIAMIGAGSIGFTRRLMRDVLTVPELADTTFALTDISSLGWRDGMEFCLALPERAGVVAIPSQGFYDDQEEGRHKVRWAFCKEASVLEEALKKRFSPALATRGVADRQFVGWPRSV